MSFFSDLVKSTNYSNGKSNLEFGPILYLTVHLLFQMPKKISFAGPMRRTLFALLITTIFGCSTDFDVIAPYKEIMVVDGLLNAIDSVQFVRVSKAYLGEGDAVRMAQQKDSINYADVLTVKLTDINTGVQADMVRVEPGNKDSGMFAYPFVVLYQTNLPINKDNEYRLEVTNTNTGVKASSQTKIVGDIFLSNISDPVDLASNFISPVLITYVPGKNSFIHEMHLKFHYRDIDPSGFSTFHVVDQNLGAPTSLTTQEARYRYFKADFWNNLAAFIPDVQPGHKRRVDSLGAGVKTIEYAFVVGSEDLDTYIKLNKPSTGVVTERPLFTTVENGVGLFTSRLTRVEFREINQLTRNYIISNMPSKGFEF